MGGSRLKSSFKKLELEFRAKQFEFAEELTFRIEKMYEDAIARFYAEYTPSFYNRTYSTYLGSAMYNDPFHVDNYGGILEAGIVVDDIYIPGHPYRADTDWVFDRTFNQGIHGFYEKERLEWNARRKRKLAKAFMTYKNKDIKIRRQRFKKFLKKVNMPSKAPYKMRATGDFANFNGDKDLLTYNNKGYTYKGRATSPKKIMDKAFKEFCRPKNLDSIFNSIMNG